MFLEKYKKIIDSNRELFVFSLIILILVIYFLVRNYRIENEGIITICQVDHYESAESGGNLYISILYQDKKYQTVVDAFCNSCNGEYYFVRIIKNEPEGVVIFMENFLVPKCILEKPIPKEGWQIIPDCK